ncbi:hypothetical protein [Phenylobacterium sp.]|uniref:hypothetical protein n=1 Tax=Phenylobacterium sp. TaxID=1871053 RepID=UPI002735E7A9|nr:hypothetical protein [Phenylobacterium sp.]MDP3855181.1 hypothetical protein [Phenylobacterium sp.]
MSQGDSGAEGQVGSRWSTWLLGLAAVAVALVYADRIFLGSPLYPGDEGAYLIHALYGKAVAADPKIAPNLQALNNAVFLLIVRGLTYATEHLVEWLRVLGAGAYFGGLLLVWTAVRPRLNLRRTGGFLLLALAFPYYRHVFTALPEGWYVGLLGVLVLVTARLYLQRPVAHALLAGALTGLLALVKPHGLSVAAAFGVLAVLDALAGRRQLWVFTVRITLFTAAFLAAGNLAQLAVGASIDHPFTFFLGGHYARALDSQTGPAELMLGVRALAVTGAASLLLAGVPIATGLARIVARWRWSRRRGGFELDAEETTFLLVLLAFAATLAMVAIFSVKALVYGPNEANRLWGRYFEFFVPMIWLAAAPFIGEFQAGGGRAWRVAMALITLVGLGGLVACLFLGVMVFPWDGSAVTAFFRPDFARWNLTVGAPLFALAVAASLAVAAASLTRMRTSTAWLGYFVALGVLSTLLDVQWQREIAPAREALRAELAAADSVLARQPDLAAAVVDNMEAHHLVLLGLHGRPHMVLTAPDTDIGARALAEYDTVVVVGPHDLVGGGWRPLFEGGQLAVFRREAALAESERLGLPRGTR